MARKGLKVFISSSMSELGPEREVVHATLREMGLFPFAWENYAGARAESPQEVWAKELRQCDVCLVVLWRKLGKWTVDEIEIAHDLGRPILMYLKGDFDTEGVTDPEAMEVTAFVERVSDPQDGWVSPKRFKEPDELRNVVPEALHQLIVDVFAEVRRARIEAEVDVRGSNRELTYTDGGHGWKSYEAPKTKARRRAPRAVRLLDRHVGAFVDRAEEIARLKRLLSAGERWIRLTGPDGIGRTSILRAVTPSGLEGDFPDGTGVHPEQSRGESVEDLRQAIWERFYEPEEPGTVEVRRRDRDLLEIKALIVLLNLELDAAQLAELSDSLPGCVFAVTMPEGLDAAGRFLTIGGLDVQDQLALFMDRLQAPVPPDLVERVIGICRPCDGNPRAIRELGDRAFNEVAGSMSLAAWLSMIEQEQERDGVGRAPSAETNGTLPGGDAAAQAAVDRGLSWLRTASPSEIFDDRDFVHSLLDKLVETERWEDLIEACRIAEPPMARGGRWGRWEETLDLALLAARSCDPVDVAAEAWALHQLGSRALVIDELETARTRLHRALERRESLGDHEGAAVTRHNLGLLPLAISGLLTLTTALVGGAAPLVMPFLPLPETAILDIDREVLDGQEEIVLTNRGTTDLERLRVEGADWAQVDDSCDPLPVGQSCRLRLFERSPVVEIRYGNQRQGDIGVGDVTFDTNSG